MFAIKVCSLLTLASASLIFRSQGFLQVESIEGDGGSRNTEIKYLKDKLHRLKADADSLTDKQDFEDAEFGELTDSQYATLAAHFEEEARALQEMQASEAAALEDTVAEEKRIFEQQRKFEQDELEDMLELQISLELQLQHALEQEEDQQQQLKDELEHEGAELASQLGRLEKDLLNTEDSAEEATTQLRSFSDHDDIDSKNEAYRKSQQGWSLLSLLEI